MRRSRVAVLPWIAGLLGVLVSLAVWQGLLVSEQRTLRAAFWADATERAVAIEERLHRNLLAVHALAGLHAGPSEVHRDHFAALARELLDHHPAVQAFEWIPRVPAERRAEFEERARDRFPEFRFRDRLRQGEMVPAADRAEHFPVYFLEPYEGNETALGFDLASSESRLTAIETARDRGTLILSDPILLVQGAAGARGFLALHPIYDTGAAVGATPSSVWARRESLTGVVLGVFSIEDIVRSAIGHLRPLGIEFDLVDLSVSPDRGSLYRNLDLPRDGRASTVITQVNDIELGGRTWRLTLAPTEGYVGGRLSWLPVGALGGGLAITAMVVAMIVTATGRTRQVRELVRSRTADLARANEALEEKIAQHAKAESERRELETQLHHAQKLEAIGRLAGGIAHDFNNLLMGIRFFAEMARDALPPDDKSRSQLDRALEATGRATDLVQQIRTFSSSQRTPREPLHLRDVVEDALRLLRPVLPSSIEIRKRLRCEEDVVYADETQLHQVLVNLCTNAADAMAGGVGRIDLKIDAVDVGFDSESSLPEVKPGRYVRLSVRDRGAGIPPEHIEHVFEPFFTTKEIGRGTGMGLAVVHGIVKKHGGTIRVRSREGKGTMFQVYLPRAAVAEWDVERSDPGIPQGNERVFFVDDDDVVADVGEQLLESLGYDVTAFTGSLEALEAFRRDPDAFDLAIVDQVMPHMTGVELVRELQALRPDLPIILCTGYAELDTMEQAKGLGVRRILSKAVGLKEYARTVRAVLDEAVTEAKLGEAG